ncbi:MAG: hypothetical protein V1774_09805 [Candidatus Eisenbacteria bacterium]
MSRTVLVVEEHPGLRRLYARHLRDAGYEVLTISPWEGLQARISSAAPGVIVVDPESANGRSRTIAEAALRADPSVALVFNTSNPIEMERDFTSWMADAFTVRSDAGEGVVRAVSRLMPLESRGARRRGGRPTHPPSAVRSPDYPPASTRSRRIKCSSSR